METTYNCMHVDTCLPCYLADHCNRSEDMLLQAEVNGTTSYQEVMDELLSQLHGTMVEDETFDYDQAELAIREEFSNVLNMATPFDDSLESDDDDSEDSCYAWFVLSWPTANSEEN